MKVFLILLLAFVSALASPFHPRVIGGQDAVRGQFPYQVSYQWSEEGFFYHHVCGGAIISPTWIVTSAYCIKTKLNFGMYQLVAGIANLYDPRGQHIEIEEEIVHPNYKGIFTPNDIALVRLKTPLEFNEFVQPISLPVPGVNVSGQVVLTGWGATNDTPETITPATTLQMEELSILNINECYDAVSAIFIGIDNPVDVALNVCTGPLVGGQGICVGDSGTPLAQNNVLIGVASWPQYPCGSKGWPSVYTKVSYFIDFIKEHIGDLP